MAGTKTCTKCKVERPESAYPPYRKGGTSRRSMCQPCINVAGAKYRRERPGLVRTYFLRGRYNLTRDEYEKMLGRQGHRCIGCGRDSPNAVDHDHSCCPGLKSCGKCVRGILCRPCNTALGMVQDSPDTLRRLAAYLEGHR